MEDLTEGGMGESSPCTCSIKKWVKRVDENLGVMEVDVVVPGPMHDRTTGGGKGRSRGRSDAAIIFRRSRLVAVDGALVGGSPHGSRGGGAGGIGDGRVAGI